ncbi:MAG: hypothetical protein HKN08_08180 [Gammaproteobacteria bacterium]|nr:hypothetical protein [Gammaproteobacteria bacterium]
MKAILSAIFYFWSSSVISQVYEEPPWIPPLPPPVDEYCGEIEKVSEPVMSYRVSQACEITDIRTLGEYQYGAAQVKREIENFSEKEMVKKFVKDEFRLFNEVKIELHRISEERATLVCTVEMMGNSVVDARILRTLNNGARITYNTEPVVVEDGKLPNLGIFTYTSQVRYTINNCPEHLR